MDFLMTYFVESQEETHIGWESSVLTHTDWADRKCHLRKAHAVPAFPSFTGHFHSQILTRWGEWCFLEEVTYTQSGLSTFENVVLL